MGLVAGLYIPSDEIPKGLVDAPLDLRTERQPPPLGQPLRSEKGPQAE
jgi:hypothetical protein